MKLQRTGLTEGSLIYNEWLKSRGLYREDTEDEFINWLYSTSGWYDSDIHGSYFDIDVAAVKKSENYRQFLLQFPMTLKGSDVMHLMVHSSYHLNGLEFVDEYTRHFSNRNENYWGNTEFLRGILDKKKALVVSSIAPLIAEKYGVLGYRTPQTHFNAGPDKNSWETLHRVEKEVENVISQNRVDIVLVSFGAYGCFLADWVWKKTGVSVATIGSGIYPLFPIGVIPGEYRPKDYLRIENGRYWTTN